MSLISPIVAEVLVGFRRKEQADWVASRLRQAHYVDATWEDWKSASEIGRDLAVKGHAIPITDMIVAAVARRCGVSVYSTDPHFDLVPDLQPHTNRGSVFRFLRPAVPCAVDEGSAAARAAKNTKDVQPTRLFGHRPFVEHGQVAQYIPLVISQRHAEIAIDSQFDHGAVIGKLLADPVRVMT